MIAGPLGKIIDSILGKITPDMEEREKKG